jgi:AraC-like DNA-binding protein
LSEDGDVIRRYVEYQETGGEMVRRREVPTGGMSLVLSFGPTMRVDDGTFSSFFIGMWDRPAVTEHDGVADGVQIDLSLEAAYALVGVSMDELTNRVVEVDDLDTVDLDRLLNRLLETPSIGVAHEELGTAMRAGPRMSAEVKWAHERLSIRPDTRIAALAETVGWSRGRLVDRFRREIGVPPKTVARLARLRCAIDRMLAGPASLAQIAAESGYSDQSHFNRDVRDLAGCTPGELFADIRPRLDGEPPLTLSA